jgi:hypothetical protein
MKPACSLPALCALGLGDLPRQAPAGQEGGAADRVRPNIVVIQTDDQDLASLSARRPDTGELAYPRILAIGARGARFENAFTCLPLCCPSRGRRCSPGATRTTTACSPTWLRRVERLSGCSGADCW